MDTKLSAPIPKKLFRYEKLVEVTTWIIVILIIFGVRFLPQKLIDNGQVYYLIGGIAAFALLYYLLVYKYFSRTNRLYLKSIADIVLIGVLIHLLKDNGQYFFALYFLPIAAAALSLEFINALLIATIASLFVIFEVFLGSMDLLPRNNLSVYQGALQIGMILLITVFCRFMAVQLREEKRARDEALAKQKALEEESKKEKEFMSLTSHQLYTPLSIIRGFSAMLYEKKLGELNPKQQEAMIEIHDSTKRMVALVSELLSISRIETGAFRLEKKVTDIKKILENITNQINKTKENKTVGISLDCPEELAKISIDADKIRQVVYNLVDNALKYGKGKQIKIACKQDDLETTISVTDVGVGIPKEDFEKLFQPFFRGKTILELDNKGTGLGLYIARLIIEKHGGRIWAESIIGKGSTFNFSLPNK